MEYDFEKLKIWQLGMELVERIYAVTKDFPKEEQFGLVSQMRRAAVSVPLNIAEGKGRYHTRAFIQFLYQARGSLYELITLVKTCLRLRQMDEKTSNDILVLCNNIAGGLNGLINRMK